MIHKQLKERICWIIDQNNYSINKRMTLICKTLKDTIDYYDWVGFYFANHDTKTLHLEAFAGLPTDHTTIPFGKGICGQVAVSDKNFVVDDVKTQDNYISCSIYVKAEIVIPLFKEEINIGQIDVDSNTISPFSKKDEDLLEWVNEKVASIL
jgi:GAF domain-containing protein|tara:strand:- start:76 stop:531 length:456 start_codon:yes stop_codon:yes gene_type:complete